MSMSMATSSDADSMLLEPSSLQETRHDVDAVNAALAELVRLADTKKKLMACRSSIRHIIKCVQKAAKSPHDVKARRHLVKNFTLKKFVMDVPGALEVAAAVGFVGNGDDQVEMSEATARDAGFVEAVLAHLQRKAERVEAELARPVDPERKPCLGRCGFFGNDESDGYCSVCYRQVVTGGSASVGPAQACRSHTCDNYGSESRQGYCNPCWAAVQARQSGWRRRWRLVRTVVMATVLLRRSVVQRPPQVDKRKCWECKRKIALTACPCRCGYRFCVKHSSTLDHECTFNFRRAHKQALERANPTVTGKKFDRLD